MDTEKALESQERNIPAVKPDWIFECCRKWERVDWIPFRLKISGSRRKSQKRSAAELQEAEDQEENEIYNEYPSIPILLDRSELDEIRKELQDLEESDNDTSETNDEGENGDDYSEADLSEGDFSDILDGSDDE